MTWICPDENDTVYAFKNDTGDRSHDNVIIGHKKCACVISHVSMSVSAMIVHVNYVDYTNPMSRMPMMLAYNHVNSAGNSKWWALVVILFVVLIICIFYKRIKDAFFAIWSRETDEAAVSVIEVSADDDFDSYIDTSV